MRKRPEGPTDGAILLKQRRQERGWTQQVLAEHLRANQSTVSRWEAATELPTSSFLDSIQDVLKIPRSAWYSHDERKRVKAVKRALRRARLGAPADGT